MRQRRVCFKGTEQNGTKRNDSALERRRTRLNPDTAASHCRHHRHTTTRPIFTAASLRSLVHSLLAPLRTAMLFYNFLLFLILYDLCTFITTVLLLLEIIPIIIVKKLQSKITESTLLGVNERELSSIVRLNFLTPPI